MNSSFSSNARPGSLTMTKTTAIILDWSSAYSSSSDDSYTKLGSPTTWMFVFPIKHLATHLRYWVKSPSLPGNPIDKLTIDQMYLAAGHNKDKWWIISNSSQTYTKITLPPHFFHVIFSCKSIITNHTEPYFNFGGFFYVHKYLTFGGIS
jgi:hypothetical protein